MTTDTAPKETVILVHGTSAAGGGPGKWYGLPHSSTDFATKLDETLAKRGSNARCWAHCTNEQDLFGWSGANTWIDRSHASAALANYISNLQLDGWQCHVVAHSHGGNCP